MGCQAPSPGAKSAVISPTQIDRLSRHYRELQGGRFAVIADFEDPAQLEIFRVAGESGRSKWAIDSKHGRAETGAACGSFTPGSSTDAIVVTNSDSNAWYLKRDWRAYNLFMISVFSPAPRARLEVGIGGGEAETRKLLRTQVTLEKGWNTARLDLAEVGERVALDDIREIRLSVGGLAKPQALYFDDLIVTNHREALLGDSHGAAGELYVEQVGRRLVVGSAAGFELAFGNGQIVAWHNLAADPNRLVNLVERTVLGPSPLAMKDSGVESDAETEARGVAVRQRIVELNRVRLVVETKLSGGEGRASSPELRWVYTVYPTGQLYVEVTSDDANTINQGFFVALNAPQGDDVVVLSGADGSNDWAVARMKSADAALLFVPWSGPAKVVVKAVNDPANHRSLLVAEKKEGATDVAKTWGAHLFLTTSSALSDTEAQQRAIEYSQPGGFQVEVGRFTSSTDGATRENGFDPASGCTLIDADKGRARLMIDGRKRAANSPVFLLRGAPGTDAWVYMNHMIVDRVARTSDGDIVFQLPRSVTDKTEIEVLTRGRSAVP